MDPAATIPLTILKPGDYVSMEGVSVSFGAGDIAAIAANYDAGANPAPLVIGHPKSNDPAWGWIKGLRVEGDALIADCGDVEPAFAELVNAGRYRRISPSFYPPRHRNNPAPGAAYPRHIGFLGAQAPAMRNLPPVQFDEGEAEGCVTLDLSFTEETDMPANSKPDNIPVPTEAELQAFAEQRADLETREAALASERAAFDSDRAAFDSERAALDAAAADARHAEHVSFAEQLSADGKVPPAFTERVVFLLDAVVAAPAELSFGEGDDAVAPVDVLRELLGSAGTVIAFGEQAPADKTAPDNDDPNAIAAKAAAYQKEQAAAGRTVSAAAAVRHVRKAAGS